MKKLRKAKLAVPAAPAALATDRHNAALKAWETRRNRAAGYEYSLDLADILTYIRESKPIKDAAAVLQELATIGQIADSYRRLTPAGKDLAMRALLPRMIQAAKFREARHDG